MNKKTFIRSIRFSDEMMDIINQQVGENFNQKFERLVYNCYMLAGEKQKEIKALDELIKVKREQCANFVYMLDKLEQKIKFIQDTLISVDSNTCYIRDMMYDLSDGVAELEDYT